MKNEINAMNSSTKKRERELEKSIATLHNDIKNKDVEISLLRSTKLEYDTMLEANTLLSSEVNKLKADLESTEIDKSEAATLSKNRELELEESLQKLRDNLDAEKCKEAEQVNFLKEENRKFLSEKDMIIDSLKDEHILQTKKLHDELERKNSEIFNIKQESDIIQVDYERLKSQSNQDGESQREVQESNKALELENKHLKESLSLLQEERGKMLSTRSV